MTPKQADSIVIELRAIRWTIFVIAAVLVGMYFFGIGLWAD